MHGGLVALYAGFGLALGLVDSLTAAPGWAAAGAWALVCALWVPLAAWRRPPMPQAGIAAFLAAGSAWGAARAALYGSWRVLHPFAADDLPTRVFDARAGLLAQGMVAGFLVGLALGGVGAAVEALRTARSGAPGARGKSIAP